MEFVDRTKGKDRAHRLLKGFLDRCLNMNPYPEDLYDAMKHDVESDVTLNPQGKFTYNLLLEWILEESRLDGDNLQEGEGHCCYCMRRIKASGTHSTLEHVIPKTVEKLEDYLKYYEATSELEDDERIMALKTQFFTKYHKRALPCPHNAAYENLVASCDGSLPKGSKNHKCCNGPRGDKLIPPMMFMPNIHSEMKYKKETGRVIWAENPDVDKRERARIINDVLCLNDDILKMIRFIWCYLSEKGWDCNMPEDERRRVIDTLRPKCSVMDKDVIQDFWQDNYWDLLDEYRYFNDVTKFS